MSIDYLVSSGEGTRGCRDHNAWGKGGCGCLQGNPHRPHSPLFCRDMESDDAAGLVSPNEKCGLSARVSLSADGVLRERRTGVGSQGSGEELKSGKSE